MQQGEAMTHQRSIIIGTAEHDAIARTEVATSGVWPPGNPDTMRRWQAEIGDDAAIALHFGLSRATVYNHRRRLGVAALPRGEDRRVREKRPRARLSRRAMTRLYGGRRYEDLALRSRPVDAVPGAGWVF